MGRKVIPTRRMAGGVFTFVIVAGSLAVSAHGVQAAARAAPSAAIQVRPSSGPGGTLVGVKGTGFFSPSEDGCVITISFTDASGIKTTLKMIPAADRFLTTVSVPVGAAVGPGTVDAYQLRSHFRCSIFLYGLVHPTAPFTVTGQAGAARLAGATIQIWPMQGPAGTVVRVRGTGFNSNRACEIVFSFTDADGVNTTLKTLNGTTSFKTKVTVPDGAVGAGTFNALQQIPVVPNWVCARPGGPYGGPSTAFTVTGQGWRSKSPSGSPTRTGVNRRSS